MAYAALISLKQTINGLLNSSLVSSSTRKSFDLAYDQTTSLQKVLERFNDSSRISCSERVNDLEGQIREGANQLEDALEFHELDESYSWEEVRQEMSSFAEAVKKMEVEYIEELSKPVVAATPASSHIDFGVEMVGHSTELENIRELLLSKMRPDDTCFLSMLGGVGSGRTFTAKALFEYERKQFFEGGAWVTVGTKYEIEEVFIRIIAQLDNLLGDYEMFDDHDNACSYLNEILKFRRCLIVLDDVRDVELIHCLRSSCTDHSNGSLMMVTTSSKEVSQLCDMVCSFEVPKCHFEDIMWITLSEVICRGESMSSQLVEYGKKIIQNCPDALIPIAKTLWFLHKTKNSPEQWRMIAADKENPIFMVGDEISELRQIKREMQSTSNEKDKLVAGLVSRSVDFNPYIEELHMRLQPERFFCKMQILSLSGMAGIGKSRCARIIFEDDSIMDHFDHRVWIGLGPNYQPEEILIDILVQIYPSIDKMVMKGDEKLVKSLCVQLANKRCLIVLDDLWSKEPLNRLKYSFPDIKGTALVTTRLVKVAKFEKDDTFYEMKLLNKEESWRLLREKVFGEGLCPSELEKVGRKIAEKCEGLPLLILTVADQLLKVEMSVECWNNVALGKQKSVFMNAHHQISKGLLPSFDRLPQHLKACFLYIGIFCNDYEIPLSKLTNLWNVERFLEPKSPHTLEDIVAEYLCDLVDDSLVMVQRKVSNSQIKTCRLHPIFWHFSNSVVVMNKLFYAMNCYDDCSIESMENQRRFCIRNNVLLGIKDVYNAMESSASKSRGLICAGPPHHYPVPLYFGSRLLRVLDAVAIRFYEFPVEVVELFHLRYLGLTCNGELPASISKLWKLQYLIVNRHINTRSLENSLLLPVEIWDMKELKHLQVMGGLLPNPKCGDGLMNLSTLLDVSAQSFTKKVVRSIPNLKRLGIQIELVPVPDEKGNPFRCLNRISRLGRLESLKCVVTNPHMRSDGVAPPAPISMFPSSLKELSLSGFGYPWKYMSTIGNLRNLEVLKLKCYAFQGPRWENMHRIAAFKKLKFLLVENTDLVQWEANFADFRKLECLSIKHCYRLQEFPICLNVRNFKRLEVVDCNPLSMRWVEKTREMVSIECEVKVHLSWIGESCKE